VALPARHLLAQGRVIAALGRTAVSALSQRLLEGAGDAVGPLPGPELRATVRPPSAALVRDYVRNVGGDPAAYRAFLPPHLFPQWAFPLASRTLEGLPYPILKIVNGGCRLAINGRLPSGEPLQVRAQLLAIEDNGRRAILRQRIVSVGARSAGGRDRRLCSGTEWRPGHQRIQRTWRARIFEEGSGGGSLRRA